ncbi:MAG: tryptophan synthase subunit alpha, partial [Paraglaciecola sp.]|uniref:tryptophan synthase subunit alpha n=1 Tax=Paraglaciecola sp. TaxID=1920173 RepID=UPI0032969FD4
INKLTKFKVAPPLLGFGISTPDQVADAIKSGAAGAISGSATVNIIAENLEQPKVMLEKLKGFVSSMKAATHK